LASDGALLTSG
jgi:hypothetical protein